MMRGPILLGFAVLAGPAFGQSLADAVNLQASAPDMLMRGAVAACMDHQDDLNAAVALFQAAGWGNDRDDGGLYTLFQDEVVVLIHPDLPKCTVESAVLGFADAIAVASDLVTIAHGGSAEVTEDEDGCPFVASTAASTGEPDDWLSVSTGGNDPACAPALGEGVMITVLDQ